MSNATDFVIENGVLKKYKGPGGNVVIPEGVIKIGKEAFYWCSSLTSIIIPQGVTTIGKQAFSRCRNLTSISIPDSVTSIGEWVFCECESLTSITIPNSITKIQNYTFIQCESLTSMIIPDSVTSIGAGAFSRCINLTSVSIPDSVTQIGAGAFSGCVSLTSVNIPDSVTQIESCIFSDCKELADSQGFILIRDCLDSYHGDCSNVVIPDGITTIGANAFFDCSSLTSITIPDSVTSIGDFAFYGCSGLTSMIIPGSVKYIGSHAFDCCSSLTSVVIPESVTSIGKSAFSQCHSLTGITIPKSVTSIGSWMFKECTSLTRATILARVTTIPSGTFSGCTSLTNVTTPESMTTIERDAFSDCGSLQYIFLPLGSEQNISMNTAPRISCVLCLRNGPDTLFYAYSAKTAKDNLTDFVDSKNWSSYDLELINNGPTYKYQMAARLLGAVSRLQHPVGLTDENRQCFLELLTKNMKKVIPLAEELNCPAIIYALFTEGVINDKNQKAARKLLAASPVPEIAFLADTPLDKVKALSEELKTETDIKKALKTEKKDSAIQEKLNALLESRPNMAAKSDLYTALRTMYSLPQVEFKKLPELRCKDGSTADPVVLAALLTAHEASEAGNVVAAYTTPGICPEAAALLEELDQDRFREILDALVQYIGSSDSKKRFLLYPICRYADEELMHTVPKRIRTGKDSVQHTLIGALSYSQTKESMWLAEKYNGLYQYAAVRGMTIEAFRNNYLYDVGLDSAGCKRYDLGNQSVLVRLKEDFSYQIELENGKPGKSLPKKGADPEKYAAAQADFSDMKKTTKKVVQNQVDSLRQAFLSGTARTAESWKEIYLCNPLLQYMARLVVWAQDGKTFTLSADGPIDSAGQPYVIGDSDIIVAHPMEMAHAEVAAWQRCYSSHSLKQPFEQVWEPVIDLSGIRPDMYRGIEIPYWSLAGKQMHGIDVYFNSVFFDLFSYFDDCKVDLDCDNLGSKDCTFEIKSIEIQRRSRASNHIIAYLDRITVYGRIKNDDVSVMNLMDHFTLAQITDFLRVAGEAQAVNVTAALLEYKQAKYPDADPFADFVLEL